MIHRRALATPIVFALLVPGMAAAQQPTTSRT
jgi:hypothetical protein